MQQHPPDFCGGRNGFDSEWKVKVASRGCRWPRKKAVKTINADNYYDVALAA